MHCDNNFYELINTPAYCIKVCNKNNGSLSLLHCDDNCNELMNTPAYCIDVYNRNKERLVTIGLLWKELIQCLVDGFSQMFGRQIWVEDINLTTSTLSSCTCSFEGQQQWMNNWKVWLALMEVGIVACSFLVGKPRL